MGNFRQIQQLVSQEASSIAFVTHIRNSYPEVKNNKKITNALNSYIRFLPSDLQPRASNKGHLLELDP